jgi:hypothetical protein
VSRRNNIATKGAIDTANYERISAVLVFFESKRRFMAKSIYALRNDRMDVVFSRPAFRYPLTSAVDAVRRGELADERTPLPFMGGLMVALPFSAAMWAAIIWGASRLF